MTSLPSRTTGQQARKRRSGAIINILLKFFVTRLMLSACLVTFEHHPWEEQVVYRASSMLVLYFILMASVGGAVHYVYAK